MTSSLVHVFILFVGFRIVCASGHNESHHLTPEERKMLSECEHPDYRTYLKCLKRPKRHHDVSSSGKNCLEDCSRVNCTTSRCMYDCYTGCKRKITEIRMEETEYDCHGDHCKGNQLHAIPNVTTNVHIRNSIFGNDSLFANISDLLRPKIEIHNIINNDNNGAKRDSECPCPGCNCNNRNSWNYGPQLMIGYGLGPTSNCFFPMTWPCLQQMPNAPINVDCSICSNPFLKYQCHFSCYPVNDAPKSPKTESNATIYVDRSKCRTPDCVGGN